MKNQPNATMNRQYFLIPLIVCACSIFTSFAGGEETFTLDWPKRVKAKIETLMEIKREAMRLPGMRSPAGKLGKRAEAIIKEIAPLVDDPKFEQDLKTASKNDIRVKIALWALDRERRPDEYARFAKWYLSGPLTGSEQIEYYYRPYINTTNEFQAKKEPWEFVPRLTTPHAIEKQDAIAENRNILEYCFFMPPTGYHFQEDYFRYNLLQALVGLDAPDASLSVFREDALIYREVADSLPKPPKSIEHPSASAQVNSEGIFALAQLPKAEAFVALAVLYDDDGSRSAVILAFRNLLTENWGSRRDRKELVDLHDRWMRLSERSWKENREMVFAEWLKTVQIKAPPPPPMNPNSPFGTFDDDE